MPRTLPHILTLLAFCCAGLFGLVGCDKSAPDPSTLPTWQFKSSKAPYQLEVPGQWVEMPAEELNRFADVALQVEHQFYLIVIPQKLPHFEGVTPPDALDLKRASLGLLKERVSDFKVEREGPLQLGSETALTVFAEGVSEDEAVHYITTYATHARWGFQIIAWGPASQKLELTEATDQLIAGWSFSDAEDADEDPEAAGEESGADAAPPTSEEGSLAQ